MKKSRLFIIVFTVLILFLSIFDNGKVTLRINNLTNEDINYLNLTYTGLKESIDIPNIKANNSIRLNINLSDDFREGSMKIYYDKNKERKEFVIIGYLQKGYNETIDVNIINNNGFIFITSE